MSPKLRAAVLALLADHAELLGQVESEWCGTSWESGGKLRSMAARKALEEALHEEGTP